MDTKEIKLYQIIKDHYKVGLVFVFSIIVYIIAAIFNADFVKIMPESSYLTWHTLMEFASIVVSFTIFTVTYFIYEESGNLKMIIFGCTFFFMGWLDLFHTFSYKGMPVFFIANEGANRATTLWILSRFIGSIGFLSAISMPGNTISNIKKEVYALGTSIFSIIIFLLVTYYPGIFPPMFIEGQGLTTIKLLLEYITIIILGISFFIVAAQYKKTNSNNEYKFLIAIIFMIFSEFAFTNYGSIYDAYNYIGHIYKILGYVLLYNSIYIGNVSMPYRELRKAKNELNHYADNLNLIVEQRTEELEKLNKILLNDIDYAKQMQYSLLPELMPNDMSVSFHAEYLAADNLSGDFYNVVKLDDDNIAIYIGDVSGHGVSAAMLSVFAYQNVIQLKDQIQKNKMIIEPSLILETMYKSFNETNIHEEKYIVMLYGVYNIKDKSFKYASAGINVSPYIVKSSGKIDALNSKGFPICKLGDFVSPNYENRTIQLEKGDKILFFSDGLVDGKNKDGEVYGYHKLEDILIDHLSSDASELNHAIKNDFFNHIGHSSKLMDDVTFLTMFILS